MNAKDKRSEVRSEKRAEEREDAYGFELVLDLHECDIERFSRYYLREYFIMLCDTINMERCKLVFWDDRWVKIFNILLPWRWFWPVSEMTDPKTVTIY